MGSKAREGAKAMSLAFVLLDFQHAGVRRRALIVRRLIVLWLLLSIREMHLGDDSSYAVSAACCPMALVFTIMLSHNLLLLSILFFSWGGGGGGGYCSLIWNRKFRRHG